MTSARTILGIILAALLVAFGAGPVGAQDKPAGQDKPAPQDKPAATAADPLSGEWDGSVETPNGTLAFSLKIKLEKDKVTGEIASEQGGTPLSGTWTDGKLSATFDYNGTPISMTGGLKDEALSGEMSYGGGQAVMSWSAKKHAAK